MDLALGLIETKGLVGAIEAADAMVKAADVKIISKEKVTGALIIIKVMGETAAVKSSVDAGAAAAQRVGELVSAHVIPRPDNQIDSLLFDSEIEKQTVSKDDRSREEKVSTESKSTKRPISSQPENEKLTPKAEPVASESNKEKTKQLKSSKKQTGSANKKVPTMDQLVVLNVHALRRIARGFDEFPIKGREISKANRTKLLDYFKDLQ